MKSRKLFRYYHLKIKRMLKSLFSKFQQHREQALDKETSAQFLYLTTQYEQISLDEETRLKTLLREQDEFNSTKARLSHGTSATMVVPPELYHRIPDIVKYYRDKGMYVHHEGDVDEVAHGHIFLLWNDKQITRHIEELAKQKADAEVPTYKKIICENK